MKVSELITKLQELQKLHGDVPVWIPCWEYLRLHEVKEADYTPELDDMKYACTAEREDYPMITLDWSA